MSEDMYTGIFIFITCNVLFSRSVTVYRYSQASDIVAKTRTELKPLEIQCYMTDIIIISAPIVDTNKNTTLYYLTKPNGDDLKLTLGQPQLRRKFRHDNFTHKHTNGNVIVRFLGNKYKVISSRDKFETFNINYGLKETDSEDIFLEKVKIMRSNDFMIGPVDYSDHGNWMLSIYYKEGDEWAEIYQVITVHIIEIVPADPTKVILKPGDDFELRFAYPIKGLDSCELRAPGSSADKVYDRSWVVPDTCGYVVKNVTADESGVWRITGVGKIVFVSTTILTVEA